MTALSREQKAFLAGVEAAGAAPAEAAGNPTLSAENNRLPLRVATRPPRPRRATPSPARRAYGLHSVTLRLSPELVQALRRTSAERSVEYLEPYTQQAIVEAALRDWLARTGSRHD